MSAIPRHRDFDTLLAALLLASLVAHFGFVFYLHQVDWPREPEPLADQYWHLLPPRPMFVTPPPPRPVALVAAARPAGGAVGGHKAAGGYRPEASAAGILQVLGARGDFVQEMDAEKVFAGMGTSTAGDGASLRPRTLEAGTARSGSLLRVHGPGGVRSGERSGERAVPGEVRIIDPPERVTGGLPPSVMVATIRERLSGIRACYEGPFNHDRGLGGKVTLRISVTPAGTVADVDIEEDTLHSDAVNRCMTARVAGWRFPPASRGSELSVPFVFQGSE